MAIFTLILNFTSIQNVFLPQGKELTHDLNHDLIFYYTYNSLQLLEYLVSVYYSRYINFGKTAVLSVLLMTAVLSVLPSSRVTLEHVEALQSCNRIVTAATARWRGSSGTLPLPLCHG